MVVEIIVVIVLFMMGVEYFESICDGCTIHVYVEDGDHTFYFGLVEHFVSCCCFIVVCLVICFECRSWY